MPRNSDPSQVLLTVAELADRRRQAPKTIYNRIAAGTLGIPFLRLNETELRFRLSDVLHAEQRWTVRTPPESSGPICRLCNGAGKNPSTDEQCQRCGGSGYEPRRD